MRKIERRNGDEKFEALKQKEAEAAAAKAKMEEEAAAARAQTELEAAAARAQAEEEAKQRRELELKKRLEIEEAAYGPEHPETIATVGNLAGLLQENGDLDTAEELYRKVSSWVLFQAQYSDS